jgi:hypothetical protein
VRLTVEAGTEMGTEGLERLGVQVDFLGEIGEDTILKRFGDARMIANMEKVFFRNGENALGHSYAGLIRGPHGRSDLQDVVELLRAEPWSKRAVLTLCGTGTGKVPCINVVQFLIRQGVLQVIYFARGQDAFRKFYADALCIASMARTIASSLPLPTGKVTGFIGSCHIYHQDLPHIRRLLEATKNDLPSGLKSGVGPLAPALSPSEEERENHPRQGGLNNARLTATGNGDLQA